MKNITSLILAFTVLACGTPNEKEHNDDQQTIVEKGTAYEIGSTTWQYELPKEFKIREDQFSHSIEAGQEFIEEDGQGVVATTEDVIVLSAARSDSSDLNVLLVSYKGNDMIKEFGVEGYHKQLIEFFQYSFETNGSNFETESGDVLIDSEKFYTIENKMYDTENNYLYGSMMFIGEISEKEVSFSLTFDNQTDKDLIVNSLLNSKFKK
jgi:hypothetical protein